MEESQFPRIWGSEYSTHGYIVLMGLAPFVTTRSTESRGKMAEDFGSILALRDEIEGKV